MPQIAFSSQRAVMQLRLFLLVALLAYISSNAATAQSKSTPAQKTVCINGEIPDGMGITAYTNWDKCSTPERGKKNAWVLEKLGNEATVCSGSPFPSTGYVMLRHTYVEKCNPKDYYQISRPRENATNIARANGGEMKILAESPTPNGYVWHSYNVAVKTIKKPGNNEIICKGSPIPDGYETVPLSHKEAFNNKEACPHDSLRIVRKDTAVKKSSPNTNIKKVMRYQAVRTK